MLKHMFNKFVFNNDFPALLPDIPEAAASNQPNEELFKFEPARGTCRVMCFHPQNDAHKSGE